MQKCRSNVFYKRKWIRFWKMHALLILNFQRILQINKIHKNITIAFIIFLNVHLTLFIWFYKMEVTFWCSSPNRWSCNASFSQWLYLKNKLEEFYHTLYSVKLWHKLMLNTRRCISSKIWRYYVVFFKGLIDRNILRINVRHVTNLPTLFDYGIYFGSDYTFIYNT